MTSHTTPELVNKAVKLRKRGMSYSEICKKVPVAKSTLSGLLKNINLDQKAKQILKKKSTKGQKLGAEARKTDRIERESRIKRSAASEIKKISKNELFLMGLMLYWAEGSKIREGNISQQVAFDNSDPEMSKLFLKWIKESLKIPDEKIVFSIYINSIFKEKENEVLNYWGKVLGIQKRKISYISYTNTKISKKNKHFQRPNYNGILRIRIKSSTDLNRKIAGWTNGVALRAGAALKNRV